MAIRRIVGAILGLCVFFSWNAVSAEEDPAYLVIGAGASDFRIKFDAAEFDLAYRSDHALWILKPQAGILATSGGAVYGWGGVLADVELASHWVLTPSVAAGAFGNGKDEKLGDILEFRSGVDLAYRYDDHSRLGLGFYHVSNAGAGVSNPGEQTLMINYSVPMNWIAP
ncbi:MAG: acyloxyacyl hydrolase [Alphaproteobacteria bacterium]|nr:acyloxyacyl hydrolase [Alphaproteobacteria bacterium]